MAVDQSGNEHLQQRGATVAIQKMTKQTRWKLLVLFVVGLCAFAILPTVLDAFDDEQPARAAATTQRTITVAAPAPAVTSAPPASSAPVKRGEASWAPGTFSVGSSPSGGLLASIPPGRYRAVPVTAGGFVMRCSALPCTPNYPQNVVATEWVVSETVLDLEPTDAAVFTLEVRLVATA
ncbi:hypothetical protein [Nocardia sp. MW-W600-9]